MRFFLLVGVRLSISSALRVEPVGELAEIALLNAGDTVGSFFGNMKVSSCFFMFLHVSSPPALSSSCSRVNGQHALTLRSLS